MIKIAIDKSYISFDVFLKLWLLLLIGLEKLMWLSRGAQYLVGVAHQKARLLIHLAVHSQRRRRSCVNLYELLINVFGLDLQTRLVSFILVWAFIGPFVFILMFRRTLILTTLYQASLPLVVAVDGRCLLSDFIFFSQLSTFDFHGFSWLACLRRKQQLIIFETLWFNRWFPLLTVAVSIEVSAS